jgi:hypothetical protein
MSIFFQKIKAVFTPGGEPREMASKTRLFPPQKGGVFNPCVMTSLGDHVPRRLGTRCPSIVIIKQSYKSLLMKIGLFNLRLALTLVYFILFPLARLFFFSLARKPNRSSSWTGRSPDYPNSHEHQF